MFYFKLHPSQWLIDDDGNTNDDKVVFRALELINGTYMISWKTQHSHETIDVIFEQEEVTQAMALGHWIITDENGEK